MAMSRGETFFRRSSWEQAQNESTGYEEPDLVAALTGRAQLERSWEKVNEKFYLQAREIELLNALQMVALLSGSPKTLDVADVGGGNGYMAAVARQYMTMQQFQWTVFESNAIANAYQSLEPEDVSWRENRVQNYDHQFDVGVVSCALNYFARPYDQLEFLSTRNRYLIAMRLPLVPEIEDIATIQRPDEGIYSTVSAQWPSWFLSSFRLDACLARIGEVLYRWSSPTEIWQFEGKPIMLEGVLLRTHEDRTSGNRVH